MNRHAETLRATPAAVSDRARRRAMSRAPSRLDALCFRGVDRALRNLRCGRLELRLPDGDTRVYGTIHDTDARTGRQAICTVHDWQLFRRVLLEGGVGAGGAYIDGDWDCDDLVALIRIFAASQLRLEDEMRAARFGLALNRLVHRRRRNTESGARRNVTDHYDLSNDFYALFLDPTMTYSCAVFETPETSLQEAQREKYRTIATKADLRPADRVLEIGCGWGGFAFHAAGEYGCRVHGITLSPAQAELARRRVRRAGLEDRVTIEVRDYRRLDPGFDKVVSIEMLEGVGREYLETYFAIVDRCLAPGGRAVIQTIAMPDARYDAYCDSVDFTQKYIFPGSHLPSLGAISGALAPTRLAIETIDDIGPDYARTLRHWRHRFLTRLDDVLALGFDRAFVRRWEYYLAFCEAGFAERQLHDFQLTLTR